MGLEIGSLDYWETGQLSHMIVGLYEALIGAWTWLPRLKVDNYDH